MAKRVVEFSCGGYKIRNFPKEIIDFWINGELSKMGIILVKKKIKNWWWVFMNIWSKKHISDKKFFDNFLTKKKNVRPNV